MRGCLYFVKTGLLPTELSDIYGQLLEDRHEGDYQILSVLAKEDAEIDVRQARRFVEAVKAWLHEESWL